ncbi:MAG: RecX family transcriptional regulator [Planctomycetes bacterium]|nr:RecX family transcriptional regulator [Planctomycetota bacterium]
MSPRPAKPAGPSLPWSAAPHADNPKDVDRARRKAVSLLRVSPKSVAELRARLASSHHDPAAAQEAISQLIAEHKLDDRALADALLRSLLRKGPVSRTLAQRTLERRAIEQGAINDALVAAGLDAPQSAAAAQFARAAAAKVPASWPAQRRMNKLLRALAARGFDEETSLDAAREAMPDAADHLTGAGGP